MEPPRRTQIGPVLVAESLEEFEDVVIAHLPARDATRFHEITRQAQRVAHRCLIARAWETSDGEPAKPGRRVRDLIREYEEVYGEDIPHEAA